MSRNANNDRAALIRLASTHPAGSPERKAILAKLDARLLDKWTADWDLSSDLEFKLDRKFPKAKFLDERVRTMGFDRAKEMWKRDRFILDTYDFSDEAKNLLEDIAARNTKNKLEVSTGFGGWGLRSKKSSLNKTSADIKSGALGFAGGNTLILQVGTKMIRSAISREELAEGAAGRGLVDVKVDLGPNDDVPAYVQTQLQETQAQLASALSQLSNVTKRF